MRQEKMGRFTPGGGRAGAVAGRAVEDAKTCTETGIKEAFEKRQYTRCAGFSTKRENLVEKQFANGGKAWRYGGAWRRQ